MLMTILLLLVHFIFITKQCNTLFFVGRDTYISFELKLEIRTHKLQIRCISYYTAPTQVLHSLESLIFVFPFVRPYKVLFLVYFCRKGLIN